MKKLISIILCVLLAATVLTGCNLFERNEEKHLATELVTIKTEALPYIAEKSYRNEYGEMDYSEPANATSFKYVDEFGQVVDNPEQNESRIMYVRESYSFTPQEKKIYMSQLVNYINYYGAEYINNQGMSVDQTIDMLLNALVSSEIIGVEADIRFYAGDLYWTIEDVDNIQRAVYSYLDSELLTLKNAILTRRGLPTIETENQEETPAGPTYPTQTTEDKSVSPKFYDEQGTDQYWFDDWYQNSSWYIEDVSYYQGYPGYSGTEEERSLDKEAMNQLLERIFEQADYIIGITNDQKNEIKQEIADIKLNKSLYGVEFTYPMLGKSLLMKMIYGNNVIKEKKLEKLKTMINDKALNLTTTDVTTYYNKLVAAQKQTFTSRDAYDAAVKDNSLILYTPSNRYLYVKHILLPFSTQQTEQLVKIKEREGGREEEIERQRAELAKNIVVYPHVNGEDDLSNPMTVTQVMAEIKAVMNRYKNSPKDAERAFNELIYKYNTDPGSFDNEKGYPVRYKLEDGETEGYMQEFADGAREFREKGYKVGQLLNNYVVTDYGIHVMYYASDTAHTALQAKPLNSYTTVGAYTKTYDLVAELLYAEMQKTDIYTNWQEDYVKDFTEQWVKTNDSKVESYKKELKKQLGL